MPIANGDIKLLKSQVLLDTPDGGGYMTSGEVVDGLSNNLFPDVSALARVYGEAEFRKLFVAIFTTTVDSYYGARMIITKAPADPKVIVSLFTTKSWSDRRVDAQGAVERYLAKGPRLTCRLLETHYTGSLVLNLISLSGNDFPAVGDAIVLRTPAGQEQFVRLMKITVAVQDYTVTEGAGVVSFRAFVATCNLGQELNRDFVGPPLARSVANETSYALLYSTNVAAGAKFYSVKPMTVAASINDLTVQVSEVYNAIVPAATSESPLIDQYPLLKKRNLSRTALAALTLPSVALALGPNTTLRTPTAIEPGSLTLNHAGTIFTDDGQGALKQGTTVVGVVGYFDKVLTFAASAPSYALGGNVISYKPATAAGASAHSESLEITQANQGLVFVYAFEPVPAPGTFTVSYLSQGRWYDLQDNGAGRLLGADTSYGSGSISYTTGSVSMTLGALPDVGSALVFQWGDKSSAVALPNTVVLPARLVGTRALDGWQWQSGTMTLSWMRGATSYTASASAATGLITGDATGEVTTRTQWLGYVDYSTVVQMSPAVLPDGDVTITLSRTNTTSETQTVAVPGAATLAGAPLTPGNVVFGLPVSAPVGHTYPSVLYCRDDRAGNLVAGGAGGTVVGTVNYTTGAITVAPSFTATTCRYALVSRPNLNGVGTYFFETQEAAAGTLITVAAGNVLFRYSRTVSGVIAAVSAAPMAWGYQIPLAQGGVIEPDSLAISVGGEVYTATGGVLQKGWDALTAAPSAPSAGTVSSTGEITVASLPANGQNTLVWSNVAQTLAGAGGVRQGVFRTASAPIKTASIQLQANALIGTTNNAGAVSGGGFGGTVDFQRGIVRWSSAGYVPAKDLSYNAVFLQYLPLDSSILGLDTARLPLDGRVPIYRAGDVVVIHHTDTTDFPGTPVVGTVLNVGRVRVSYIKVLDNLGAKLATTMYDSDLDAGTVTLNSTYALGALQLPLKAEHRIEDEALVTEVQISGLIKLNRPLTHSYPANSTMVSGALIFGDLQARVFGKFSQETWTSVWSDTVIGNTPTAQYNDVAYPIGCTNRGAQEQRWALIFTSAVTYRVVGDTVGQIATGDVNSLCSPTNPATLTPYFSLLAAGWGSGWSAGYVLRFNTAAANAPAWLARTTLQGLSTVDDDAFVVEARGDIDRI